MLIGSIVQIVIAVALVIILCVIGFMIYNSEMLTAIRESGKIKKRTVIFEGVKDLNISKDEAYNTIDPSHPMYRNIEDSINQKAGAEYTYNFWLYLGNDLNQGLSSHPADSTTDSYPDNGLTKRTAQTTALVDDRPLVLLLRGSKTAYPFKGLCYDKDDPSTMKVDVLVKQPMIKLERDGDVISVELNTQTSPEAVKEQSRDVCDYANPNWEQVNAYRIAVKGLTRDGFKEHWNMITLVVQDTYPNDPLPLRNKIRVRLYINGLVELDRYVDGKLADVSSTASLMRGNAGDLYFAPQVKLHTASDTILSNSVTQPEKVMMADLVYYNYAIDVSEVKSLFAAKFKKTFAPSMTVNDSRDKNNLMEMVAYAGSEPRLAEVGKAFAS